MFAIYKNGSVGFRSTADNLYNIKKTNAPDNVYLKPSDDTLFEELPTSKTKEDTNLEQSRALRKYRQMANIDNSTVIYHVKDIMNKELITISSNETVSEAYETLRGLQISQIPILNSEKKIVGLINKKLILNMLIDNIENPNEVLHRKLEDVYLPEVITTFPITDIRRVAKVMIDLKIDAVPVVTEKENLVGIVSKSDIIKAVSTLPRFQLWS